MRRAPSAARASTPTAERLAAATGLQYTRFHTTALCSPTRAALLSGRNHHTVGMGGITEIATSAPGYSSIRPNTCAPLAEILRAERLLHRPVRQVPRGAGVGDEPDGPVRPLAERAAASSTSTASSAARPTSGAPAIYDGTAPIEPPNDARGGLPPHRGHDRPGHRLGPPAEGARAGQAVLRLLRARRDHAPHHVPTEWIDKYRGQFDTGWDALREQTFARQKELGVIPPTPSSRRARPRSRPGTTCRDELKPVLARQMEVYAGFLEHTDHHVGRRLDALGELGVLDDTLVYYIIGDNGASAEGTPHGTSTS